MTPVHTLGTQPTLEDARREADEAIAAVGSHVTPTWRETALAVVRSVATAKGTFTADDVREDAARVELPSPHDPRAWGAVMRGAVVAGWIAGTGRTARSRYRHGALIPIWASLIVRHPDDAGTDDAPTPVPVVDLPPTPGRRAALGDEAIALLRRFVTYVDAAGIDTDGDDDLRRELDVYLRSARSLLEESGPACTACQRPASIEVTLERNVVDINSDQEAEVTRTVYRCTEHRTVAPRAGEVITRRERVQ